MKRKQSLIGGLDRILSVREASNLLSIPVIVEDKRKDRIADSPLKVLLISYTMVRSPNADRNTSVY